MPGTAIEFFSGSKTVSSVLCEFFGLVISVDINKKFKPDLCIDVLKLTREDLPSHIDFMWFSPPCDKLSRAADSSSWLKVKIGYRNYSYYPLTDEAEKAVRLVDKCVEIISWFPGCPFVIENPIGRIHHIFSIRNLGHYRYAVNYADFGFSYSKETYLFTNILLPLSTKKVHSNKPGLRSIRSRRQRQKVPADLAQFILQYL